MTGEAADRFHDTYRVQPTRWLEGGDSFHEAADAVDRYASTLSWAQDRAADAMQQYALGQEQTASARRDHDPRTDDHDRQVQAGGAPAPVPPFHDPGEATRVAARELLERARGQLRDAGDSAAGTVATARDRAPEEPGFWDKVGSALSDAGEWALHGLEDIGIGVVNGLASYGNAIIHHPGDTAMLLGGLLLMGVSGLGEGAGVALDATGVGAVAGVPLNVVSTGGIAAGATAAGAGALSLANHAANEDRVQPLEQRAEEPASGSQGRSGTKTDRLKEHLTDWDLDAARRELDGEVVATKSGGQPWDHVGEVRDAQRGLVNRIEQLKRMLGDSRLSEAARADAQAELSEASRLLDHSRSFVPRP